MTIMGMLRSPEFHLDLRHDALHRHRSGRDRHRGPGLPQVAALARWTRRSATSAPGRVRPYAHGRCGSLPGQQVRVVADHDTLVFVLTLFIGVTPALMPPAYSSARGVRVPPVNLIPCTRSVPSIHRPTGDHGELTDGARSLYGRRTAA